MSKTQAPLRIIDIQAALVMSRTQTPLRIIDASLSTGNEQDSSSSVHYRAYQPLNKEGPLLWTDAREMAYHDTTRITNRGVM
jgi:hypothetical protein